MTTNNIDLVITAMIVALAVGALLGAWIGRP